MFAVKRLFNVFLQKKNYKNNKTTHYIQTLQHGKKIIMNIVVFTFFYCTLRTDIETAEKHQLGFVISYKLQAKT